MKRLIHRAIPFVILFLMFPAIGWADDPLPADFGDITEDNPTDAPIDTPYFWVLLFLIGGYIAYKKLQPKTT